jgi:sugar phosphate isomerase/epimerase
MKLSISTHWNAHRHADGGAMLDEITDLGLRHAELGYNLTLDLVPGVRERVASGAVEITSLHNYCPVPVGAPRGHPELFVLASRDRRVREAAVTHTRKTIEFAADIGAAVVVAHSGNVDMRAYTRKLISWAEHGRQQETRYEKTRMKLLLKRDKRVRPHLENLYWGLEQLLPLLESTGVTLALEILPTWEAIPTEAEMTEIARRFNSPHIRYWYDTGHGGIRENLGLVASLRWLERLSDVLAGMHIHDVIPPAHDHVMPPEGNIDFSRFRDIIRPDMPVVLEPAPGTPAEVIRNAIALICDTLGRDTASEGNADA